ncbi:hypothetical protein WJ968_05620 [Achromobacter xylosoxidans]
MERAHQHRLLRVRRHARRRPAVGRDGKQLYGSSWTLARPAAVTLLASPGSGQALLNGQGDSFDVVDTATKAVAANVVPPASRASISPKYCWWATGSSCPRARASWRCMPGPSSTCPAPGGSAGP